MLHIVDPKVWRTHPSFPQDVCCREIMVILNELVNLSLDGTLLPVCTDRSLAVAPEVIQWIELRTALGQPQQLDIQILSQRLGVRSGMSGILVQQHRHWPATI